MNSRLKASLVEHMQKWLDEECDDLGASSGIWQDSSCNMRCAHALANAAEAVIDGMSLQITLSEEMAGE